MLKDYVSPGLPIVPNSDRLTLTFRITQCETENSPDGVADLVLGTVVELRERGLKLRNQGSQDGVVRPMSNNQCYSEAFLSQQGSFV